jgi:HK97 family phage portal protein
MAWRWPFRRRSEERASYGGNGWPLGVLPSYGISPVPPYMAESLSAVVSCTSLIADSIASLPASLVVDGPDGSTDAPASAPAWRILQRPSRHQSWPSFVSWLVGSILLRGNGLARVDVDNRGAVVGLTPIKWDWIVPNAIRGADGSTRLAFDIVQRNVETSALGLDGARLMDDEVLFVKSRTDSGLIGKSAIARAAGVVSEGIEISQTASGLWRNGLRVSGVLTAPSYLTPEQRLRKREWLEEYSGSVSSGRTPLLEGGWKLETMSMSSVDAEFLASRRFSVEEIARLFGVPSPLIQLPENSTPSDMSVFTTLLTQMALLPMIALITSEFNNSVLTPGMHLIIDADALARGSFASSVSAICALVSAGVITPNDGREALGWSELPGGDVLRVGAAPSWMPDATGLPSMSPKPGPKSADGLAEPNTNAGEGSGRGNGAAAL